MDSPLSPLLLLTIDMDTKAKALGDTPILETCHGLLAEEWNQPVAFSPFASFPMGYCALFS